MLFESQRRKTGVCIIPWQEKWCTDVFLCASGSLCGFHLSIIHPQQQHLATKSFSLFMSSWRWRAETRHDISASVIINLSSGPRCISCFMNPTSLVFPVHFWTSFHAPLNSFLLPVKQILKWSELSGLLSPAGSRVPTDKRGRKRLNTKQIM